MHASARRRTHDGAAGCIAPSPEVGLAGPAWSPPSAGTASARSGDASRGGSCPPTPRRLLLCVIAPSAGCAPKGIAAAGSVPASARAAPSPIDTSWRMADASLSMPGRERCPASTKLSRVAATTRLCAPSAVSAGPRAARDLADRSSVPGGRVPARSLLLVGPAAASAAAERVARTLATTSTSSSGHDPNATGPHNAAQDAAVQAAAAATSAPLGALRKCRTACEQAMRDSTKSGAVRFLRLPHSPASGRAACTWSTCEASRNTCAWPRRDAFEC